jgi:hypothetical protein
MSAIRYTYPDIDPDDAQSELKPLPFKKIDDTIPMDKLTGMPMFYKDVKVVMLKHTAKKCECGGAKLGYQRGNAGHSSWCPWSKP